MSGRFPALLALAVPRLGKVSSSKGGAVALVFALAAAGAVGLAARFLGTAPPRPSEPTRLGRSMIDESFGLGTGVTYPHPDVKAFDYFADAPEGALVLLHFQSRDISEGEVIVTANEVAIGSVPADLIDADQVFHEMVIQPGLLKTGTHNRIAFESTRNPPHRDSWRVWNLWVESRALPQLSPGDLIREASLLLARAEQSFARREIATANRYRAWADFRAARFMLEGLPDPKPDLYRRAQDRAAKAQRELDRLCARLMLQLQRSRALGDLRAARVAIEEVKSYFPGDDHPCPWKADERRAELKL